MTAFPLRSLTALLALTVLIGGCSLGRSRATASPREQTSAATMTADLETVRRENAQLRDQQEALQTRLESLQHTLAQTQEEQKRYRESMTKNFDLLEQSVALTLSKTITADLGGKPVSSGPLPALQSQPAPQPQALSRAQATPEATPVALAPARSGGEAVPAVVASSAPAGAPKPGFSAPVQTMAPKPATAKAATAHVTPVALRSGEAPAAQPVDDPDLLPPQSPRHLTAHQQAKPLYEKGFALFAKRDYDQSIIVFQNFLTRFPDDIYSDNAQFWIAEAYLNESRPREAEEGYRAVLRNYEHRSTLEGFKTPDAIYRLGQMYQQRADLRRARRFYEVLVERFPETSAGRKAQRELATLAVNTAAR